eukprot:gene4752-5209_t
MDNNANEVKSSAVDGEEEEEVHIDPNTLKPDLYFAASTNETDKVLELLNQNVPPTHIDIRSGLTALHWAALNGNVLLVKKLLEKGASEPYRAYITRKQKESKAKEKRIRRHESKLEAITEQHSEDPTGGPVDESKDDPSNNNNKRKAAEDEDDELDEDHFDMGLDPTEQSVDYTRNTPLLWAVQRGHLRIIWLLLTDGYSPNDIDKMENNSLHLAAAYGDVKNLQVLINSGGNANAVNYYKNKPLDMAKNKAVRDMLAIAMEAGASLTLEDRARKHDQNIRQYKKMTDSLQQTIQEAIIAMQDSLSHGSSGSSSNNGSNSSKRMNRLLMDAITMGDEYALDQDLIDQAAILLKKLEVAQDLEADISALQRQSPISTQTDYQEHVYKLERSIERAAEIQVEEHKLRLGLELIRRCQIEYWLSTLLDRLKDVITAVDANEHDMNKLRAAIEKGQILRVHQTLLDRAQIFLRRLDAELGMSRALKNIPTIRLPLDNPPEGYYTEDDIGHIKETEGYPLPPADTGEYVWIPALSYTNFMTAINNLRNCYNGADILGANPTIITESKERLMKAEKELKQLETKDTSDKAAALEVVKKLAKKLKKKKKSEKK